MEEQQPTDKLSFERNNSELVWVAQKVNALRDEIGKHVIGQSHIVELILAGIFANGHVLLEGVPGVAKTLSAKLIARLMKVDFSRIQFTPDLMPSDVIGTSVFNMKEGRFIFNKGPIFSNLVLIDEINRAPAKTQAALFEVMEERQITFDGIQYPMEFPFLVIATQNPIEQEGTYSLPEAQLDRFIFKIKMDYPSLEEEAHILTRYKAANGPIDMESITPLFSSDDIKRVHTLMQDMVVEASLINYIAAITHRTRSHPKLYLGASPRASLSMLRAGKALAALRGRDFITPEDIQYIALPVLTHRIILTPEAEMEGIITEEVIRQILAEIEIPR
ncbi:MAG: AAA family ATPase [Flavobacteriales bacterium]